MYLFGQDDVFLLSECEKCGRVLKIQKDNTEENEVDYMIIQPISCPCGNKSSEILKNKPTNVKIPKSPSSTIVKCPKCSSTQIAANKKGFGLGKAVVGGVVTGGVGLLGGFTGSNKVVITCLNCGHRWDAGKR